MSLAQVLLPEIDQEMKTTRRLLEVVPEHAATWAPHAKSMSLGRLAAHVANLPLFLLSGVTATELDVRPLDGSMNAFHEWRSLAVSLARFDDLVARGRAALANASDADLAQPWTFKRAGVVRATVPRTAVIRSFFLNHIIHHRGQLSVYLRLRDVPLPSIYGPTADTGV